MIDFIYVALVPIAPYVVTSPIWIQLPLILTPELLSSTYGAPHVIGLLIYRAEPLYELTPLYESPLSFYITKAAQLGAKHSLMLVEVYLLEILYITNVGDDESDTTFLSDTHPPMSPPTVNTVLVLSPLALFIPPSIYIPPGALISFVTYIPVPTLDLIMPVTYIPLLPRLVIATPPSDLFNP